ncbi:Ras-GAP domain-containing protein [Entamoeba marina]
MSHTSTTIHLPTGKKHLFENLFFQQHSPILFAYFKVLLQNTSSPDCNTYSRMLIDYFSTHGRLPTLFGEAAHYSVDSKCLHLKCFSSKSPLMIIYNEYTSNHLIDFARGALRDVLQALIYSPNISTDQLIGHLRDGISLTLPILSPLFIQALHDICKVVQLHKDPHSIIERVSQDDLNTAKKRIATFAQFIGASVKNNGSSMEVDSLVLSVSKFLEFPSTSFLCKSGIDFNEQDRLHRLVTQAITNRLDEFIKKKEKEKDKEKEKEKEKDNKLVNDFLASIEKCDSKVNEIQALGEVTRLLRSYSTIYSSRLTGIAKDNNEICCHLYDYENKIKLIKQQINEEQIIKQKLLQQIDYLQNTHSNSFSSTPRSTKLSTPQ